MAEAKQGTWFSHTNDEFKGRICVKQKAGGWAVIREAEEIGGPAKSFCSLAHGDEPAKERTTTRRHAIESNSCISVACMAPLCRVSSSDDPCVELPAHCVQGHVWIEA